MSKFLQTTLTLQPFLFSLIDRTMIFWVPKKKKKKIIKPLWELPSEWLSKVVSEKLHAVLNKPWKQYPTKQQLYGYLHPISQTIQIRWSRHTGYFWWSKGDLISIILLWTSAHGHMSVGRWAKVYFLNRQDNDFLSCSKNIIQSVWELLLVMLNHILHWVQYGCSNNDRMTRDNHKQPQS